MNMSNQVARQLSLHGVDRRAAKKVARALIGSKSSFSFTQGWGCKVWDSGLNDYYHRVGDGRYSIPRLAEGVRLTSSGRVARAIRSASS